MSADRSPRAANAAVGTIGKLLIVGVWGVFLAFTLAITTEVVIGVIGKVDDGTSKRPNFYAIRSACRPFATKYIHPNYLFFYPFDAEEREALNTPICSVDADGFRGEGPAFADDKQLAFIVGGSSVFGMGSSDATTIAGALNRLQSEYHVVNAGVQSWNSTQELFRVAHQLLAFEPALVIALDGANDIQIPIKYHERGLYYPPGTPEGFDDLSQLVGDVSADYVDLPTKPWNERFFPRLSKAVRELVSPRKKKDRSPLPAPQIAAAAEKYRRNHELMDRLVRGSGGRFVSVFQPVSCLHTKVDTKTAPCRDPAAYREFHRKVFEQPVAFERLDFSNLFDAHYDAVPVFDPKGEVDISEDDIFFDAVHLWDEGDRKVAEALRDHLVGSGESR